MSAPAPAPAPAATHRISRWEWLVATIGLLLVLGMLGVLAAEAIRGGNGAPDLVVRLESPQRVGAGWTVPFEVENRGARSAAGVAVRATGAAGAGGDAAEAVLDYVPGHSRRRGAFTFAAAPGPALAARVTAWVAP